MNGYHSQPLVHNAVVRNSSATSSSFLILCPTIFLGFTGGSYCKESVYNVGDLGLIPGLGRSPGGGKGFPLQYSGLENSMDRRAW